MVVCNKVFGFTEFAKETRTKILDFYWLVSILFQSVNLIFERARPFSFCKGHFHWTILKPGATEGRAGMTYV